MQPDNNGEQQNKEAKLTQSDSTIQFNGYHGVTNNPQASQNIHFILGDDDGEQQQTLHPLFIEMQTLYNEIEMEPEWRETARWIKFQEEVEEGGNRWSKPHVPTLALQALFELRNLISNGSVQLDAHVGNNFENLVELVCENLVNDEKLERDLRNDVRKILLKSHLHQFEYCRASGFKIKRKKKVRQKADPTTVAFTEDNSRAQKINGKNEGSYEVKTQSSFNYDFMRKVPKSAEACSILIGEVDFLQSTQSAFLRLKEPVVFSDLTEVPVPTRFVLVVLGPTGERNYLTEIGRSLGALMSDEIFHEIAYRARTPLHLLAGIDEFLEVVKVLPPGKWDPTMRIEPPATIPSQAARKMPITEQMEPEIDEEAENLRIRQATGLTRTGHLFGGFINDVKRKAPWYWSDYKDAISMQCVASWIFLYFACLSTIITFGGMLGTATGRNMAAMESLVAGLICGVMYGAFSGQPLNVLSSTGPVLVFEKIVFQLCLDHGWDFMTFRFWVGTWIAVILFVMTATDASASVCYITRFTEENFATLIGVIFIYDAFENVMSINKKFPMTNHVYDCVCTPPNGTNATFLDYAKYDKTYCLLNNGTLVGADCAKPESSNVFLMSLILFGGTYIISMILKNFRNALFFPTWVRQFTSDFSVVIGIVTMTVLDYFLNIATPKLEVPSELKPTLDTRNWIIPPFSERNPSYSIILAFIPALLGTVLIFLDQQITAVIVNRKEFKLKKGGGYHLDLFVLSVLIQICSFMGLPWFVAATVLSLNLVNALKQESECSAPGEKPQFLGVNEQRVTQILIGLTIGLSVYLMPILKHIPMPVLFGVFLYMGVNSLNGLQFFDRVLVMFMPAKYQPDYPYLRQVPLRRVHLFTLIQVICLAFLWLIKSFPQTSILFPLMLVVMIGIRKLLDLIFTQRELKILDDTMPEMWDNNKKGLCQRLCSCFNSKKQTEPDFGCNVNSRSKTSFIVANKFSAANMRDMEAGSNLLNK